MTYDLRRLRLKGLLERIGRSHRYRLTALGVRVVTFFTRLDKRIFRPGLAATVPGQTPSSELAEALDKVAEIVQSWIDDAFQVPVMHTA